MEKVRSGYIVRGYLLEGMVEKISGYSRVYVASSLNGIGPYGSKIAVKVFNNQEYSSSEPRPFTKEQIRDFRHEGKIAVGLRHENIVNTYKFIEQRGNYFLFMKLLDTDLRKELARRKTHFSLDQLLTIAHGSASAIACVNKRNMVYLDLNPSNILLSFDLSMVNLTDFGATVKKGRWRKELLKIRGTKGYIAPEVEDGKEFDHRADIYSQGKVIDDVFNLTHTEKPKLIKYIVDTATRTEPEERFSSMEEISSLLEEFKRHSTGKNY